MTFFHRGASIFAGIFSLIQAVIWVVISILFVAAYTCNWDVPYDEKKNQNAYSILYITYFKGTCHGGHPSPRAWDTYVWMVIYAIVSACWIPCSALLIVAAATNARGKFGACLYIPWLVITSIIILVDLIGTIIYGLDISRTLTLEDYNQFMYPLKVGNADGITALPAIEITLFFSRVVVIWIINVILLLVVIQAEVAVVKSSRKKKERVNYDRNITNTGQRQSERSSSNLEDNSGDDLAKRWVVSQSMYPRNTEEDDRRNWSGDQSHESYETNTSSIEPTPPSIARVFSYDGTPMKELPSPTQQSSSRNGIAEVRPSKPPMMGWSYTQGVAEVKPNRESIEGIEKPPVPVPDYTMHIATPRRYPTILQQNKETLHEESQEPGQERSGVGLY